MERKTSLREALANETTRQKRSYRRATLIIAIVALVGAAWLVFSATNVVRLDRRAKGLKAESQALQLQNEKERIELEIKKAELELKKADLAKADEALQTAETTLKKNGSKDEALKVISKELDQRRPPPPLPRGTPTPGGSEPLLRIRFRGTSDLAYISTNINLFQLQNSAVLVSFSAESSGGHNSAAFRRIESTTDLPWISLIALPEAGEHSAIQAQLARGKTLIVQSSIFVNGERTKVAAFK
jgi:hypothetical protein